MRAATCVVLVLSMLAQAAPPKPEELPAALRDWGPWVLHDVKDAACPFLQGGETRACAWPGRLELRLDDAGGRFTQAFQVYRDAWLPLPGEAKRWPQAVQVDGKPAVVVADSASARPQVLLTAGEHSVTGAFAWDALPEALEIPPETGLLSLAVKGAAISLPNRDGEGRVFLQRAASQAETDRVELDVHRRVTDDIPLVLSTRVTLKVSGKSREMLLGRALPEGFVPMALSSPLPVRIEADGKLRLQVRPGTWVVALDARHDGPVAALKRPAPEGTWMEGDEVWVFDARPSLRQVLVEGVSAVDPSQTTLPSEWRGFPAWAMGGDDEMKLTERRRGDSEPAPDVLNLSRTLWLDFSGGGYTVSDRISGQLHKSWRLEVQPGTELGRVVASGADQSITRLAAGAKAGVELRQGALALEADSRLSGSIGTLSAVSWDADFNSVSTTLQLPPGWRLVSASGADDVPGTWLQQWTLFDLFIVLIITVAMARLFGLGWGVLALVALGLSWQERHVPQYVWLFVLMAEGLFRVLPVGRLKTVLQLTRVVAWGALVVLLVSFSVQHVREGMYPALARAHALGGLKSYAEYSSENAQQYARSSTDGWGDFKKEKESDSNAFAQAQQQMVVKTSKRSFNVRDYDKNATVQTGPGLPRWEWTTVQVGFSGPVQRDQRLSLLLLGPTANFVLAFLRVVLLGLLALCVLGFPGRFWPEGLKQLVRAAPRAAAVLLALGVTLRAGVASAQPEEGEVPAPEILDQLRERLLEKPECAPTCASSPRLLMEATPTVLRMRLEVLAGANTAVPLPGSAQQWVPETVVLDGRPAAGLRRQPDGSLWLAVQAGAHQVQLEGALPARDVVQVALPLRSYRVEAKLDGWTLDGLHEDGVADENLQLSRQATNGKGEGASLQVGTLPPFVRVERTLVLGLTWTVETRVERVTPTGSAVVLEVPLLAGESVTSSDVRVQGGKALVNMGASTTEVVWSSVLDTKTTFTLTAPTGLPWVEVWRLDVSPVWHVTFAGIPVVHQQDESGVRLPEWRPWPSEAVTVEVSRPEALPGQTLTIDQSLLRVSPGSRATDVAFTANFRTSRGGLHSFTLPDGAQLQSVAVNGQTQPIRQEGRVVSIPLVPGGQSVELSWRQPAGLTASWNTPSLDVGSATVNADLEVNLPQDRWVLLVRGPGLGPAVLFWSFLLVLLVVSFGLGRTQWTPLSMRQWLLLALGLSQVPMPAIGFVFAWLVFLGWRNKQPELSSGWFNLRQLAVVGATGIALLILGASVYEGLLGLPEMQVRGNGSTALELRWFLDRTDATLPTAWVFSVPMLVYRGAMLTWSLWMALALLSWLKWGWAAFSHGGLWRRAPKVVAPTDSPPPVS